MLFDLRPYQRPKKMLADYLPWGAMIDDRTVVNKDGGYATVVSFRGPDADSLTTTALGVLREQINNVIRRLGERWCVHVEARRQTYTPPPIASLNITTHRSRDEPRAACVIEQVRHERFSAGRHFLTSMYLTLTYLPPKDRTTRMADLFIEQPPGEIRPNPQEQYWRSYQDQIAKVVSLLEGIAPEVAVLEGEDLLTYLHSTVSPRTHRVGIPDCPIDLAERLSDAPMEIGLGTRLGDKHLATIGVRSWVHETYPTMLGALLTLPFELRWVVRYLPLDRAAAHAHVTKVKRHWFAKRKNMFTLVRELISKEESQLEDPDARAKADDADHALALLGNESASFGYATMTISVWDETEDAVVAKARAVQEITDGLGWVTELERINAFEAWLGSLPGHAYADIRRPLMSSRNVADIMPFTQAWSGEPWNDHLDAPALMQCATGGSTPFWLNLHSAGSDVGHTLVAGPTGAGKSTLLNLIAAQWLRYEGAQVYFFDKGGSARVLTYAMGGDFYDLGEDGALRLQPLRRIDSQVDQAWGYEWVLNLLRRENVVVDTAVKERVWEAIEQLRATPPEERTVTHLLAYLQDQRIRDALRDYADGGAFGHLFDADSDPLGEGRWQTFELEAVYRLPRAAPAVLSYLFHRLEHRFTDEATAGRPTLLILDEAWLFLADEQFRDKIHEWLKVLRKRNVAVVFATQSMSDVAQSPIAATILENCPTRILLPNQAAHEPLTRRVYEELLGLNDRELDLLAAAIPKRDYYVTGSAGRRLIELDLSPFQLTLVGASRPETQRLAEKLWRHNRRGFLDAYLSYALNPEQKGVPTRPAEDLATSTEMTDRSTDPLSSVGDDVVESPSRFDHSLQPNGKESANAVQQ